MTADAAPRPIEASQPSDAPSPGELREPLRRLLAWRRDVRRFRTDPLEPGLLERLLDLGDLAPSVGLSQPWR